MRVAMVDRSDSIDVQVEQKLGASTALAGIGEKDLDSSIPNLDSRAGYAHFPVHTYLWSPYKSSSRYHRALRFFILPAEQQCTSCYH